MRAYYTNRKNMAASFRMKMTMAPPLLRACNGRRISRVAKARKEIIQRKVYDRAPTDRPLSETLLESEQIRFRGVIGEVSNTAPYAQIRNDAMGPSVLYGHDKELHFAEGAVEETREENLSDTRATMQALMAIQAE